MIHYEWMPTTVWYTMPSSKRRAFLKASGAAGVATLTGFAGCTVGNSSGGGNGSGGNGSSTGGGSDPITIAATIPKTGKFSSIGGDLLRGYKLGVDRMNDNDVLGRKVNLIVKDDQSDAQTVRKQLSQILSNNDVDMIWSTFSSLLVGNDVQVAEQNEIPLLTVATANGNLHTENETKWVFSPFPKTRDHVKSTKNVLNTIPKNNRPSRVGLWVPNSDWSVAMADAWEQTLSNAGYDVVLREKHQEGASDFSTLISKTQSANVEVLLGTETPGGGITAMKQLTSSNYTPKFIQFVRAADTSGWNSGLGKKGRYVCMEPGWVPGLTGNGNAKFKQRYEKKYSLGSNETIPVLAGAGYNATQTAEQALKSGGSTDKSKVQKALRNGTFKTVCGTFSFAKYGRPKNFTSPVGQWLEGNQHLVYPESDGEEYRDLVYLIPS